MAGGKSIRAGAAFVELATKDNALVRGLAEASAAVKAWGAGITSVGVKLAAAGVAGLAPFLGAVGVFSDMGADLLDMSQRTGIAVEALSALNFAASQSGADMETLEVGIKKMQDALAGAGEDVEASQRALAKLGLTAEELQGLTPDEQFLRISDRLVGLADASQRTQVALDLFGKAGTKLIPTMMDVRKQMERAQKLGVVWTKEEAESAEAFGDTMGEVWEVLKKGVAVIGGALVPVLSSLLGIVTGVSGGVLAWLKANQDLVVIAFAAVVGVTALGVALTVLGVVVSGVGHVIGLFNVLLGIGVAGATVVAKVALFAWSAAVLLAKGVLLLFNAQLALYKLLLAGGAVTAGAWTVATLVAKAATWLFNAALTAMNVLLGGAVLLAAVGTIVILGAALAVAGAAAWGVYQAGRALFEAMGDLGAAAAGPIGHIGKLFGEWRDILKEVVGGLKDDMPKAMEVLKAGFALALAQIKDLWPPLWTFIQDGFAAVSKLVEAHFKLGFARAIGFMVEKTAELPLGIGKPFAGLLASQFGESLEAVSIQGVKDLTEADAKIKALATSFKAPEESKETKAARAELDAARQELADSGRTSFLGGLGLSAALAQLKDIAPAVEEQNKLTRRQQTATTGSLASVANAMLMALGGTTDLKHLRVAEEQRALLKKLVERGGVGPIFQ